MKNPKHFKRVGELHDGINSAVALFLRRAKSASREAAKALREYRAGAQWQHDAYLRYRAERAHWIWAAKFLLLNTTDGVVHNVCNARVSSAIIEKYAAEKTDEVLA